MKHFLRSLTWERLTTVSGATVLTAFVLVAMLLVAASDRSDAQSPIYDPVTMITITTTPYGMTTATINYTTDQPAATTIRYGTSASAMTTVINVDNSSYQGAHTANFTGLTQGTTYYYEIIATSQDGTTINSTAVGSCVSPGNVCSFRTTSLNVSNIAVAMSGTTATLSFTLSQAAGTAVNYGTVAGSLTLRAGASASGLNYTATLPNLPASAPVYFEIVADGYGTGQRSFYTGPLSIIDPVVPANPGTPVVTSVSDRSAQITWTTNLASSHQVNFGLDQAALNSHVQSYVVNGTNHSVTIASGLLPGTTYYYTVTSVINPDVPVSPPSYTDLNYTVTSGVESFTTTGVSPGTPLLFTTNPVASASNDEATITFGTNIPTSALVEFNTNAGLSPDRRTTGYQQACNDPAVCTSTAPAWIKPGATDHSIRLSGLSTPDRDYYYRVTVIDQNGRRITSGTLRFRTTLSQYDRKFSTGTCADGTPIRECRDGLYCRPGGIGPVYDCRPGLECTYECPSGSTCQDTGDCTKDPSPGDALTACNPKSCYMKCDNLSGSMSGRRCGVDADCSSGKCIVGSFTTPAAVGCYASWPSCDANIILKVRPDRVCGKWYTCKTSVEIMTTGNKLQNQCLDLSICDSLSPNGQCNNLLEGRQCSNDPLRFCREDADCIGTGAFCLSDAHGLCSTDSGASAGKECTNDDQCGEGVCVGKLSLTFKTPEDVAQIKGLTGYAFAGLDWHAQPGTCNIDSAANTGKNCFSDDDCGSGGKCINAAPVINGYYPLSIAEQYGQRIDIPNGNFEDYAQVLQCSKNTEKQCSLNRVDDCIISGTDYGPCVANRDTQLLISRYWETITPSGSVSRSAISVDADISKTNPNQSLKITPTDLAGSGARTTTTMGITTTQTSQYLLGVVMKSARPGQRIQVSLMNSAGDENVLDTVTLGTSWQQYLIGPTDGMGGPTSIVITTVEENDDIAPIWVDNLTVIPALKVSDTVTIPQSCRVFPNSSSPSCDYTDTNSISYRGYRGYCLERDPLNPALCLSWWPVDIVYGNNVFGTDVSAGYNDRQPLYVCAESEGVWNRSFTVASAPWNGNRPATVGPLMSAPFCDETTESAHEQQRLYPDFDGGSCSQQLGNFRPMTTVMNGWLAGGNNGPCDDIENVGNCRGNTQPGFCWCNGSGNYARNAYPDPNDVEFDAGNSTITTQPTDGGWAAASLMDQLIHKYDIEYFRVHMLRYNRGNSNWPNTGDLILNEANGWRARWGMWDDRLTSEPNYPAFFMGGAGLCEGAEVRLRWDPVDQHLMGIFFYAQRCAASGFNDDNMSGFFATGLFFMKEQCTKLVQVATEKDVSAWVDRTSKTGTFVVPGLNYRYITDLSPFGGAAPPSTTLNPSEWQNKGAPGALNVEGIDMSQSSPYQMRAGAAYACTGNCSGRMCTNPTGNKVGYGCLTSADCIDSGPPPVSGQCVGNGVCVEYDSNTNKYTFNPKRTVGAGTSYAVEPCTHDYVGGSICNAASGKRAGRACTTSADCKYSVGKCVNKDNTGTGVCDANSGVLKGDFCSTDATCQTTYDGDCLPTGTCPTGQKCCSNKDEKCLGGLASAQNTQTFTRQTAITPTTTSARICSFGDVMSGYPCNGDGDCNARCVSSRCQFNNVAIGKQPCTTNADCGGQCITTQTAYSAQYYLMRLFVKAYTVWQWTDNSDLCPANMPGCYVNTTSRCQSDSGTLLTGAPCSDNTDCGVGTCLSSELWSAPKIICRVCSGGPNPNKACTSDASCGSGGRCVESSNHPTENAPGDVAADYCAVKPTVFNVENGGSSALIEEGSQYTLKFNTTVDREQRPLAGIEIDWGDGSIRTVDAPIKIAPRDDPSTPHVYSHAYHCQGDAGVCDPYYIKIRVIDNWGWCSNGIDGTPCNDVLDTWTDGPIIQVLK